MRVVALIAAYNEGRFIGSCLEHLQRQGIESYLIDNQSTDKTVEIAERFLGRGLLDIETLPRSKVRQAEAILKRKERLAGKLDADWFIHLDPDEVRLPPSSRQTLQEAIADADAGGFTAVNFVEFSFIPTRESPDHDHPNFAETMRWYYCYRPIEVHRLNAWKNLGKPIRLVWSWGHRVKFEGLEMYPMFFPMRHYLFLGIPHLLEKYSIRTFSGWRSNLAPELVTLPSQSEMKEYRTDEELDARNPHQVHFMQAWMYPRTSRIKELTRFLAGRSRMGQT